MIVGVCVDAGGAEHNHRRVDPIGTKARMGGGREDDCCCGGGSVDGLVVGEASCGGCDDGGSVDAADVPRLPCVGETDLNGLRGATIA